VSDSRVYAVFYAVFFVAFLAVAGFNAYSSAAEAREFTVRRELPALGLAAAARLESAASRYKRAGEELLRDSFMRDWLLDGEGDVAALRGFMENVRATYGLLDASVVSDRTETYYGTDGRVLKLDPKNIERDGWYYLYRDAVKATNIDSWYYPETGVVGVYVNVPIFGADGSFLGVTGGGIDATAFNRILKSFDSEHDTEVFLIRTDGKLVYASDPSHMDPPARDASALWGKSVFDEMRRRRLDASGMQADPAGFSGPVLWAGFMADWDTYLVIERKSSFVSSTVRQAAFRSLLTGGVFALLLFALTASALRIARRRELRFKRRSLESIERLQAVMGGLFRASSTAEARLDAVSGALASGGDRRALGGELSAVRESMRESRAALRSVLAFEKLPAAGSVDLRSAFDEAGLRLAPELAVKDASLYVRGERGLLVKGSARLMELALCELLAAGIEAAPARSELVVSLSSDSGSIGAEIAVPGASASELSARAGLPRFLLGAMGASLEGFEQRASDTVCRMAFHPAE